VNSLVLAPPRVHTPLQVAVLVFEVPVTLLVRQGLLSAGHTTALPACSRLSRLARKPASMSTWSAAVMTPECSVRGAQATTLGAAPARVCGNPKGVLDPGGDTTEVRIPDPY
jgi:hypothetical protein